MRSASLLRVRPFPFAVGCWVIAILIAALANGLPAKGPLTILRGMAGLLLFYGYPLWVVFFSGLVATRRAQLLAAIPLLALLALGTAEYIVHPEGLGKQETPVALWQAILGGLIGISLFLPLGAAAATLHAAEVKLGIDRVAGGVTAFLWFFYFFLGWAPLHKRVRVAAGVEE